jgi:START domain
MSNQQPSSRWACISRPCGVWALLACLLIAVSQLATANDWELLYEGDDLRVLRRDYAGSELDEIQGVVRVQASLNALMALLKDAPFNRHWVYRSGGAQILQESGYATAHVYGVVDAPPPLSDRDSVVRFDYQQDPASRDITITITNVPDYIPPEPNLVRVPDIGGHWFLKPQADGWVEVTYQVHGDPGGWIPAWLANQAAQVSVKNTLQNLVTVVGRYSGVRSEFVQELDTTTN